MSTLLPREPDRALPLREGGGRRATEGADEDTHAQTYSRAIRTVVAGQPSISTRQPQVTQVPVTRRRRVSRAGGSNSTGPGPPRLSPTSPVSKRVLSVTPCHTTQGGECSLCGRESGWLVTVLQAEPVSVHRHPR